MIILCNSNYATSVTASVAELYDLIVPASGWLPPDLILWKIGLGKPNPGDRIVFWPRGHIPLLPRTLWFSVSHHSRSEDLVLEMECSLSSRRKSRWTRGKPWSHLMTSLTPREWGYLLLRSSQHSTPLVKKIWLPCPSTPRTPYSSC